MTEVITERPEELKVIAYADAMVWKETEEDLERELTKWALGKHGLELVELNIIL